MIKKQNNKKGSVLVFTLFVMILTLITGISLMASSLSGRRSTLSSGKSVNAFQVADSGLEIPLAKINEAIDDGVFNERIRDLGSNCDNPSDTVYDNISGGEYRVSFYDVSDNQLDCNDDIFDVADSLVVSKIRSVGTYRNTVRSVETTFGP